MFFEGLDQFSAAGLQLLDEDDPVRAHSAFVGWVDDVHSWLSATFPNSGLAAAWASQQMSELVRGGQYYDDPAVWTLFKMCVQGRLRWLGNLPTKVALSKIATPAALQNQAKDLGRKEIKLQTTSRAYVDPSRINELKALKCRDHDLSKLVRLCEEINVCFATECYLAMLMLTRAVIDHVPPIFGCKNFAEVTNNFAGSRSFKEAMAQLDTSSRKIADHYLHTQIRRAESLPNATQVDFSNALDFLLAEVGRVLKQQP